jgi:hypothetical protein
MAGDRVRVEAWIEAGRLNERYLAKENDQWIPIATDAADGPGGPVVLSAGDGSPRKVSPLGVRLGDGQLVEEFAAEGLHVERTLRLCPGKQWLHVTTRMEAGGATSLHAFTDRFAFLHRPDWSYAPSVGGFVPDVQYKAPVILVQSARAAFGIVPDLGVLDAAVLKRCNHALDLDVSKVPFLSVGFVPARMAYHSVYEADPGRAWTADKPIVNAYYLFVTASAEPSEAYREVVRMHWTAFGRPLQLSAAIQQRGTATPKGAYSWLERIHPIDNWVEDDSRLQGLALWDAWRAEVWGRQTPQRWLVVPLAGGQPGGGVETLRWGPGPSVYLSAWFNTLRTSFGMALYARRTHQEDLLLRARQTVELALKAPGPHGAFKCVAVPGADGRSVLWAAGDGNGGGLERGYLGYDMSWTAYWLLRWRGAELPGSGDILGRCRSLARFFCERQLKDGMLPTRFAEDGSVIGDQSRIVKAETGPVALFLLELYSQDRDPRWLGAAERGLAFLAADVVPNRQWYDFEAFWSCSPRMPHLDVRTGQWPANDLALGQSVAAFLEAYRVTGGRGYLDQGERLVDYLLLYQQCWTNPLIDNVGGPATLLGGFTTQNSDAEWSDARQSQVGNILVDYYRATGNVEYLERGVAALRAQFPVSPCENFAHSGYSSKTGVSSFHWGTGSGMAGVEIDEDYLRDAVVDVATGQAVGVNGLDVGECSVAGGQVRLRFSSPFAWKRLPVFVFHRCDPKREYRIFANGAEVGTYSGEDLGKGIKIPLGAEKRAGQ